MKIVADNTFDNDGIEVDKLFRSLLVKRTAFTHEKEVRLLYYELNENALENALYSYEVDPHTMIDQIMLDPRLAFQDVENMKREIRAVTGFKGPIKRSRLYTPPIERILEVPD